MSRTIESIAIESQTTQERCKSNDMNQHRSFIYGVRPVQSRPRAPFLTPLFFCLSAVMRRELLPDRHIARHEYLHNRPAYQIGH